MASIIEFTYSWYGVNDVGIYRHSAWKPHLLLKWEDVEKVEYSSSSQWFIVKGKKNEKVRLHMFLNGLPSFGKMVQIHVPEEKWKNIKDQIRQLAESQE